MEQEVVVAQKSKPTRERTRLAYKMLMGNGGRGREREF